MSELAVKLKWTINKLVFAFIDLKIESFIGGLPIEEDKVKSRNCHIAVGAPGRIKHLIHEDILKINSVNLLVLDEVDKLMETSFISDFNEIFNKLPDRKQIITTSATYPKGLYTFLCTYMLSPTYVGIESGTALLLGLKQFVKIIEPYTGIVQEIKLKNEEVLNLFSTISFTQCVVFTNYQTRAESISNFLNQKGWCSMYISAAQTQSQRLETVKCLKDFKCKILLTTDLTARGIDAVKVDLVINYDIPVDAFTYLHRMGRTGRYGSSGVCIDFVSEGVALRKWQNMIGLIGGDALAIPKLPKFHGTIQDLLKLDIPSEYYIFGTKSNTSTSQADLYINNDVLDLTKRKNKCNRTKNQCPSYRKTEESEVNLPTNVIKVHCKQPEGTVINFNEVNTRNDQLKYVESTTISEALISESTSYNTKSKNIKSYLQKCTSDYKESLYKNDTFTTLTNILVSPNGSTNIPDKSVFNKNKALFQVTQILSNNKSLKSDLYIIHYYISALKNNDKNEVYEIMATTKSNHVKDILKSIDTFYFSQETDSTYKNNVGNTPENIFSLSYQFATKSCSKHWSSCLTNLELDKYQDFGLVQKNANKIYVNKCMEDIHKDDEYFLDHEFSDVSSAARGFRNSLDGYDSNIQHMEHFGKSDNVDSHDAYNSNANWEHFFMYFSQCSQNLWQTGLCFKNVQDFDSWFTENWQGQIFDVRNYIQQNIYIEGLNNYRKFKYHKNCY